MSSLPSHGRLIKPSQRWWKPKSYDWESYQRLYRESLEKPETFWAEQARRLTWSKPWHRVKNTSFESPVSIQWFEGGELNVTTNCLDRHLPHGGDRVALIWEPDQPHEPSRLITYRELHRSVSKLANVLKARGVKRGDRVTIYLPMIPEAAMAMLACARMGAVHSVIFGGFSAESIVDRIHDAQSHFVITADEGFRGGKIVPLKRTMDEALERCPQVKTCLVVRRSGGLISWQRGRDFWFHEEMERASDHCPPESMGAEDPLFMLYTSGSTNKPKGVLHTTGGYLTYVSSTYEMVFDHRPEDIFFCSADLGWVTGHSYVLYGPLSNAATVVLFEGIPTFPDPSRYWQIIDKYKVSVFYTAPTAIRALMREGDTFLQRSSRSSLRLLGSVGEPINPEPWLWYYEKVGGGRCPVVDTWWQTETGGIMISPLPGATPLKPGSATLPLFGIRPEIVDANGRVVDGEGEGNLCIADSWPGQMRGLYGDHDRFESTYFKHYAGKYFTGDGCRRDADGYYWITGRVDDVLNVAGHRLGTAEIESALVSHPKVAEAAVVGIPHDIKGQGIYAFVTLKASEAQPREEALPKELVQWVRKEIGPVATPDHIQWAAHLPKTRSGKIMRRILRKIAEGHSEDLGDISTLADPSVVPQLIEGHREKRYRG